MSQLEAPPHGPVPPQALEAEENILGALMLSPNACDAVADVLDGTEFYRHTHATIYRAAVELYGRGEPVDAITLTDALERSGELEKIGGRVRLHELAGLVPASANVAHYARIVKDAANRRAMIRAGGLLVEEGYGAGNLDAAEQLVYSIATGGREADLDPGAESYISSLQWLRENPGSLVGVPSGFPALDEITQGFAPGNLIVVGARPSMGKSALALCVTANLLGQDRPVGVVTLEMSKPEIMQRLVSIGANIAGEKLRNPRRLTDAEWSRAQDAASRLATKPLYVREAGVLTPLEVRAQIRRLKARVPDLALVVVDYLQLMTTGNDNRVQEVSEISRALKGTARDLDIPIVALSQLSRSLETRPDKRPILSDLRESGSIEQDADVVLFLYRHAYYHEPEEPTATEWVEVNVAKQRNGPTDRVRLVFLKDQARFTNPAPPRLAAAA